MPMTQHKIKKKKQREKEVRKTILRRREAIRRHRKEQAAQEAAMEKEYFERRGDPTLTEEQRNKLLENMTGKSVKRLTPEERQERDDLIVGKLKNNIAMLEEMEKQYLAEQEARKKTNELLEDEGAVTLQEKVRLLEDKAKAQMAAHPDRVHLITEV
jgi:hypothetical protein